MRTFLLILLLICCCNNSYAASMDEFDQFKTTEMTLNPEKKATYDYMSKLQAKIKDNWYPPKMTEDIFAIVNFEINAKGEITNFDFSQKGPTKDFNLAAIKAIKKSAPFNNPPKHLFEEDESIKIKFSFDYNIKKINSYHHQETLQPYTKDIYDSEKVDNDLTLFLKEYKELALKLWQVNPELKEKISATACINFKKKKGFETKYKICEGSTNTKFRNSIMDALLKTLPNINRKKYSGIHEDTDVNFKIVFDSQNSLTKNQDDQNDDEELLALAKAIKKEIFRNWMLGYEPELDMNAKACFNIDQDWQIIDFRLCKESDYPDFNNSIYQAIDKTNLESSLKENYKPSSGSTYLELDFNLESYKKEKSQ